MVIPSRAIQRHRRAQASPSPATPATRLLLGARLRFGLLGLCLFISAAAPLHPPPPGLAQEAPGTVRQVGALPRAQPALEITLAADLAFLPCHASGVRIVDVSDPAAPRLLSTAATAGDAYEVAVEGDRMVVAAWSAGLEVWDIADPSAPRKLGGALTRADAHAVALKGDLAITGDWSHQDFEGGDPMFGLVAFDLSDPTAPREIGRLDTPGWAGSLQLDPEDGDILYVADAPGGLRVVDISDPSAMRELGSIRTEVRAYGLDVVGDRVFIADNTGGLRIVDVSEPSEPVEMGSLDLAGAAYDVAVAADRAWIAQAVPATEGPGLIGQVDLVDVSDPTQPRSLASLETVERAWGVAIGEDARAYVAATGQGLLVLEGLGGEPAPDGIHLPWLGRETGFRR